MKGELTRSHRKWARIGLYRHTPNIKGIDLNRRRIANRRGWPDNLYQNPDGYFYYRNPNNNKKKGLGRDKAYAFSEARAANKMLATMKPSALVQWVSGVEVMSLKDWLPGYRKLWIEKQKPAESTIEAADRYLKRFAATEFAWKPMNQITAVEIAAYLDDLAANSGPGAATNMRSRLLDVFEYAVTKGHIETGKNPVAPTLPPNYEPKRDRLSLEQFKKIRANASPWLVNAMNLALLTGQRVSDISELKFSDVRDGFLHIDQIKSQGETRLKLDLNIRLAAIDMSIGDAVKQCRDNIVSAYLVHQTRTSGTYKAGGKVALEGISAAFTDLRDELKITATEGKTPPTFHEIRSLAKRLYTKEYGKEFSQALLGHKTEAMSAKYEDLRGSDWQIVTVK
jgi:integrase